MVRFTRRCLCSRIVGRLFHLFACVPTRFVQGKLGLDWRRWLTEHLCGLYFQNRSFYALKIGYLSSSKTAASSPGIKGKQQEGSGGDGNGAASSFGAREEEQQQGGIDNPVSAVSCAPRSLRVAECYLVEFIVCCVRNRYRQEFLQVSIAVGNSFACAALLARLKVHMRPPPVPRAVYRRHPPLTANLENRKVSQWFARYPGTWTHLPSSAALFRDEE